MKFVGFNLGCCGVLFACLCSFESFGFDSESYLNSLKPSIALYLPNLKAKPEVLPKQTNDGRLLVRTLANGVEYRNIGSLDGGDLLFKLQVPKGTLGVKIELSGGVGDADLYVRMDDYPTDSDWDCRSMMAGNNEHCVLTGLDGVYFVRVKSFVGFSGLSIKASFQQLSRARL